MVAGYNVLFVCTGNSARSAMAEALLNDLGKGRFTAYSAGSKPTGTINPLTLRTLELAHLPIQGLRSKSWSEFAAPDSPKMDFVVTVCDTAAGEPCPAWPGHPTTAHWGFPDPALAGGSDAERLAVFADVFKQISRRVELLVALPLDALDRLMTKQAMDRIGKN